MTIDHHNNIYVYDEGKQVYFKNNELGFYYDLSANLLYFVLFAFNPVNRNWYYYKLHNDDKVMFCSNDHDLLEFMRRNYVINSVPYKINIINN